ncbi:hypothetical protein LG293_16070 (plasmid) [Citricoccus nitrophenolicus]
MSQHPQPLSDANLVRLLKIGAFRDESMVIWRTGAPELNDGHLHVWIPSGLHRVHADVELADSNAEEFFATYDEVMAMSWAGLPGAMFPWACLLFLRRQISLDVTRQDLRSLVPRCPELVEVILSAVPEPAR